MELENIGITISIFSSLLTIYLTKDKIIKAIKKLTNNNNDELRELLLRSEEIV